MSTDHTDLIKRLEGLGATHWAKHPHTYFSHSGGRVSLREASQFYDQAVALAEEAAKALKEQACPSSNP